MPITVTNGTAFILDGWEREQFLRAATGAVLCAEAYLAAHPDEAQAFDDEAREAALPKRQRYPETEAVKPLADLFAGVGNALTFRDEMLALLTAVGR